MLRLKSSLDEDLKKVEADSSTLLAKLGDLEAGGDAVALSEEFRVAARSLGKLFLPCVNAAKAAAQKAQRSTNVGQLQDELGRAVRIREQLEAGQKLLSYLGQQNMAHTDLLGAFVEAEEKGVVVSKVMALARWECQIMQAMMYDRMDTAMAMLVDHSKEATQARGRSGSGSGSSGGSGNGLSSGGGSGSNSFVVVVQFVVAAYCTVAGVLGMVAV